MTKYVTTMIDSPAGRALHKMGTDVLHPSYNMYYEVISDLIRDVSPTRNAGDTKELIFEMGILQKAPSNIDVIVKKKETY